MRLRDKHDAGDPALWFRHAADRLRGVDALRETAEDVSPSIISMLHRAMELYLKGYLLASGWQQEKTKNLSKLLQSAAQFDPRLGAFLDSLKELNRDFRLTQYPGGDLRNVSEHFALHRQKADEMISLIRQNLPHFFSKPATK